MSITSRRKRQSASLPRSSDRLLAGVPLSWALTVPFVLLTVGATTLVGYLSYRNGEQTVTELASQLMQEKGDQTLLYLERSLAVPHLINQLNADNILLGQLSGFETTNPEPLERFFWRQLRRVPDITTLAMANNRGGMVGAGRRLPIGSDNMSVYRTSQFARGNYTLSITNAEGKIIETKTISENYDARTRPWYQAPAKAGKATWSPIYQFVSDVPVLGISAGLPVYTDSGQLRGILAADIDLKSLSHFLAKLNLSPSGQIFIVERSGSLVASSTNQSMIRTQAGEAERINAGESEDPTMRETMAQLNARSHDLSQTDGIQQFTIEQSRIEQSKIEQSKIEQSSAKWVRVIPFQDQYGLDWLIVIVVPESDFMQAVHANQATTLLLCLLTLGGATGLGIFATNRLTRHFSQLNRVSQELAAGNLDRRLLTNGSIAELNSLAHTFNRMADQIQDSFDRIKTALAESKEKFTTIFRTSPEAVAIVSMAEGRMLEVNDSFLKFFGYPQDEVVGKTALELQIWHKLAQRNHYRALLEQAGSVRNLEAQVCTRSGEIKTVLLSAEVRSLEGQDCIIVMHRDITHLKQAEAALRQSEERNRAILSAMPDLMTLISADGVYLDIVRSHSLVDLIPLDVNPIGKHLSEFVSAEVAAIKLQLIEQTLETGEMQIMEQRLWLDDCWQHEEVRAVRCGSDAVLMMIRNITDRKQAEIALQQSENRFQQLASASPVVIYTLVEDASRQPRFEYISPAFETLHEVPISVALQDAGVVARQVHPDDRESHCQAILRSITTMQPFQHEWRMITPSGKLKWVQANSQPQKRGDEIVWHGTIQDVTERKEADVKIQQLNQQLHNRVNELQTLFNVLPIGVAISEDSECRVARVNPALAELLRISTDANATPSELNPDRPAYRVYQDGRELSHEELPMPYASTHNVEIRDKTIEIVHPDGTVINLLCYASPLRDEQGNVRGSIGGLVDITDRKRAEEALRRSEARIQQVADASPAIIYTVEEYGGGPVRFEFLSPGFEEVHEIPVADVIDNPALVFSYFHPDDREGYQQAVAKAAAAMQLFQHTWRIFTPSGKMKWLQGSSRPERQASGSLFWHGVILDITELKQAEEALRQSEAALRRAQQVAHVGSWQVDVPTGKVTWSEESFHIMGWDTSQPEPSLSQFYQLIHPDDRDLLQQQVEAVIDHQIPYRVEFRVIHPDGSLRYVEARGEAVVSEGRTAHVIGTNLDITERIQAEEALRNSEATKNQILKTIPDLILWMTADGTCIDMEGNSITNLYAQSEAIGKNLSEILPPNLAQMRMNAIEQALKTGEVQIYEQQVVLQSETVYEEVRVIGVGDCRVLVIVRDITDRKRAEAALLDSETRFRSAFSDAPIGMALIRLDDRWLKVNPMLCDMLDFTEPELLSKTASSLVHPEDWHKLQRCVQQVLSSENRNAQIELRFCRQQGQVIWGLISLSLVRDGQEKPLYYVAQIQDITERQAIDRMKNEFISIVSHELRTPLTAICGFLGLLNTGIYDKKPEKAKHMIGQALDNSNRLVRLVNDILDLEWLSSGKIQLIKEACSAEELMQRAVAGVQSLADQARIQLVIVPTAAEVWADSDCIIQTLTNLLSNAIKFSPPHSAITLSAQARTDSVLFSVQDQGRGIPADKLETIFGRFQQVDVSDSRQKGGTGLGLAICQSIVQQHGGSIWAESILGSGSTFYFTLPLMSEGER